MLYLNILLYLISLKSNSMTQPLSMDQVFLSKLNAIIRDNLQNEKFGVDDLSREMGMSYSKIHRKIRSLAKKSVSSVYPGISAATGYGNAAEQCGHSFRNCLQRGIQRSGLFQQLFSRRYYGYPPGEVKKRNPDNGVITGENLTPGPTNSQRSKGRLIILLAVFLCMCRYIWRI